MTLKAQHGDRVTLHYSGFDEDGENVDSTLMHGPKQITLGRGELIAGLEQALMGMAQGEQKTLFIEERNAFTDPAHLLHGKDIIYELKVLTVERPASN